VLLICGVIYGTAFFMEQNKFTQREGVNIMENGTIASKNYEFLKKKMIDMLQADSADYRLQKTLSSVLFYKDKMKEAADGNGKKVQCV